ncbi:MAG: hypothetical protein P8X85_06085 [Desulfobacterales bacterium]
MKIRNAWILLLAAIGLLAVACTPMRMGLQEAALERLLEKQATCDGLRKQGFETDAGMVECQNNSNALEKSAGEYATEGYRQGQAANKVFWFSLAATAGWRSQRPGGMQDAITYADEGVKICDDNPGGIQPGDCAFMYAIPAFVANESVAVAFIDLQNQAGNATKGKSGSAKKKVLQELYLALQPNGATRIETMASNLLRDGWESLQTSWQKVHKLKGLHQEVICALAKNQLRIEHNLKTLHDRAKTLPLAPQNTNWLSADLCQAGEINPQTTAELNLAPEGADFRFLDNAGKQSLMQRAMVLTYCTWQVAKPNPPPEKCRRE